MISNILMRIIVIITFCAIVYVKSYAQIQKPGSANPGDSYFKNFTPKNPQSSSLGSFGKVPVNYYTGLPEVSLDLLTLPSRELSLPIRIAYDATGVKQDDIASPVGLKWNLDAGGFIARQMNGFPDEQPTKGFFAKESVIRPYSKSNRTLYLEDIEDGKIDSEPDEFVLYINGRSIKFLISNGVAVTIPHQKVKIAYTLSNNKLNQFVVQLEDGNTYTFGGSTTTVEEKKTETMHIGLSYYYLVSREDNRLYLGEYKVDTKDGDSNDLLYSFNEVTKEFYNSKWYLVSIRSPNGDQINFSYANDGYLKYATQPNVVRRDPMLAYTDVTLRSGSKVQALAYVKPDDSWLESGSSYDNTWSLGSITNLHVSTNATSIWDPKSKIVSPGQMFVNQSLITETNIRLISISSSVGNRVNFTSSKRSGALEDLPNAIKYDRIDLLNQSNTIIKSIRFNFKTVARVTQSLLSSSFVETLRPNDPLWISEALLFRCITNLRKNDSGFQRNYEASDSDFYAEDAQYYAESEINNLQLSEYGLGLLKKYAYEGLKAYNFRRLYLESITESSNDKETPMYSFSYFEREKVRRRLTTFQDVFGFCAEPKVGFDDKYRSKVNGEPPIHLPNILAPQNETNNYAVIASSYYPDKSNFRSSDSRYGILTKIVYPTAGSTEFNYGTHPYGPFLSSIQDKNEIGVPVSTKRMSYVTEDYTPAVVLNSFQNYKDEDGGQRRFKISTSFAQNKSLTASHGALRTFSEVKVYDGVANGYEKFTFTSAKDVITPIYAEPADVIDANRTIVDIYPNPSLSLAIVFPFPRNQEKGYARGFPLEHVVYDVNGNILKYSKNNYSLNPNGFVPIDVFGINAGSYVNFYAGNRKYRHGKYKISSEWFALSSKIERVYNQNSPQDLSKAISVVTKYEYDPVHLQPIEVTTYNEAMPNFKTINKTKYVTHADYAIDNLCLQQNFTCVSVCRGNSFCLAACAGAYQNCLNGAVPNSDISALVELKNRNQLNTPVEIQNLIQEGATNKLTSAVVYKYNWEGSGTNRFIKPKEIWGLKQPLDPSAFSTSKTNANAYFEIDPKMRKLHRYDLYDQTAGNLLQQTTQDGTVSTYQWGFNNSLVTQTTINPGSLQQQSSYVHQPLIGLSQTTDANGRNSNFEYDQLNRLKLVRDHDNNISGRYRYHYVGDIANAIDFNYFTYSSSPTNNVIQFIAKTSGEPGTTLTWDFNLGTVLENAASSQLQTYATPGFYTVKLVSNHPEYPPATVSKTIRIVPPATAQITSPTTGTSRTVCGNHTTTCDVSTTGGDYTYAWEYNHSGWGNGNYLPIGTNSRTLNFTGTGVQSSSSSIRCKITDAGGNSRYSNYITISHYCTGQPGPEDCPPGQVWNSRLGRCELPASECGEDCFPNGKGGCDCK
jgi:hypothetical protein